MKPTLIQFAIIVMILMYACSGGGTKEESATETNAEVVEETLSETLPEPLPEDAVEDVVSESNEATEERV